MTNPFMIPQPFANNGNKNDIKNIREASDPIQTASWLTGFPPSTMTPKEAGGAAPNGLEMNGVLNAVSQGLVHRQRGERMQFSFAYATSIGGYPKGAIIQSNDTTKEFQSLVDDNVTDPNTTLGTFWRIYSGDGSVADGSQTQKGLVQFATAQQVQDKLNVARAINPADVVRMFRGGFDENDFIEFPNGLIIQWGVARYTGGSQQFSFKKPFPNKVLSLVIGTGKNTTTVAELLNYDSLSSSGFFATGSAVSEYGYFVVGY